MVNLHILGYDGYTLTPQMGVDTLPLIICLFVSLIKQVPVELP